VSAHTGARLAEIGFLLLVIAGVWLAASTIQPRWAHTRTIVAGVAIAASGVLLIVAVHWGHFG
jgi:hypothetical protein